MILPFLLHHANRAVKDAFYISSDRDAFYAIKDAILKKHGSHINYDVQHIPGKKCHTCNGSGVYTGYYMMSGEKWHDTCNRCWRGWFKLPVWICLSRIKFGSYYFHKPLKREQQAENPFTLEELGWKVTERPIIEGYIDHSVSIFGVPSLFVLFYMYDKDTYLRLKPLLIRRIRSEVRWKLQRLKSRFDWRKLFPAPKIHFHYLDQQGCVMDDDDLP